MAVDIEDKDIKSGDKPALAGLSPAIRYEWQKAAMSQINFEADDAELNDISAIIQGNKAITGKAVYSTRNSDQTETQKENQKKHDADEQEVRELMHLAEWNAQKTFVGGVEMTNEEAQEARQRFIENEDFYAHKAAQLGYIHSDEEDELKIGMRQKKELEDKKGRGIITNNEQRKLDAWDQSRLGKAGDHVTADIYQDLGVAAQSGIKNSESEATIKPKHSKSSPDNSDIFQSAPKLKPEFTAAALDSAPSEKQSNSPAQRPVSREVNATGLNI